jgi:hypothetical protein
MTREGTMAVSEMVKKFTDKVVNAKWAVFLIWYSVFRGWVPANIILHPFFHVS